MVSENHSRAVILEAWVVLYWKPWLVIEAKQSSFEEQLLIKHNHGMDFKTTP